MLNMLDEASYQGQQWTAAALRGAAVQVVAVKASEGLTYLNPDHSWQVGQARAAGCTVMHYHLIHPELGDAFDAEAQFFTAAAAAAPGDLLAYDCEPEFIDGHIAAAACSSWVHGLSMSLRATGASPVCYATGVLISGGYLESVRDIDPLWYAYPGANPASPPTPPEPWLVSFLQYGQRSGTDVDSAYFGDAAQLAKLAIPLLAPGSVVVPGLVGSEGNQALARLSALGLAGRLSTNSPVVSQTPGAGTVVTRGAVVDLGA